MSKKVLIIVFLIIPFKYHLCSLQTFDSFIYFLGYEKINSPKKDSFSYQKLARTICKSGILNSLSSIIIVGCLWPHYEQEENKIGYLIAGSALVAGVNILANCVSTGKFYVGRTLVTTSIVYGGAWLLLEPK